MSQQIHYVVVTMGSAGDLFPFMAMALALRARAHRVSFLAPEQHGAYVVEAGLDSTGLPVDEEVLRDPDLWHPTRGFGVVWRATRPAMAHLLPFIDALPADEDCVLLVHPLALPEAALCRARHPRLSVAAAYLAPSNLPSVHDPLMIGPWRVPRWVPLGARRQLLRWGVRRFVDPVALDEVNAARAARGLAPLASMLPDMLNLADLSIALFPSWFGPIQPDWPQPMHQAGFPLYDPSPDSMPDAPLAPELASFLAAGAAPVVFTPGTGNLQAGAYFRHAAAATRALGLRAIFLTLHRAQLPPELPSHVLWQGYVPLRRLLPQVAALVHHGGIGTTAEALRAGTPQLVVPLAHDQFDNAARVAALDAGLVLHAARVTRARMTRCLRALLAAPAIAQGARRQSARLQAGAGLEDACRALEALARPGQPGG
ncbi:glycosyltransferase [Massilia sp. 9096]|uniref:glycosyltransferase n=1 Tax=Massilia sp. 9096 TaxID=1500894 RepID=UPI00055B457E|nr:glycosyltransferase [Massilia sp. 9096]